MKADYTEYMSLAVRLARKAEGMTSPNPLVGAVIIDRNGRIIGKGFHKKAGEPHAEIMALRDAGNVPAGSTMVVTLEPCNHFGRTPPCTHALRQAGIKRVVFAVRDPNPDVKGRGAAYLKKAGIDVIDGVYEKEARRLNESYFKHVTTALPYVSVKLAMSMDGRIAAQDGSSKWITSEHARTIAHRLRNTVDAVVVGAGTVKKDDPSLTIRHVKARDRQLFRIIFDTHLSTPVHARVISNQNGIYKTMILTASSNDSLISTFTQKGVEVVRIKTGNGMLSLHDALKFLGKRFMHILIEGGSGLVGGLMKAGQVDKLHVFIAPKIIGEDGLYPFRGVLLKTMKNAINLKDVKVYTYKGECLIEGYPEW